MKSVLVRIPANLEVLEFHRGADTIAVARFSISQFCRYRVTHSSVLGC